MCKASRMRVGMGPERFHLLFCIVWYNYVNASVSTWDPRPVPYPCSEERWWVFDRILICPQIAAQAGDNGRHLALTSGWLGGGRRYQGGWDVWLLMVLTEASEHYADMSSCLRCLLGNLKGFCLRLDTFGWKNSLNISCWMVNGRHS